MTCISHLMSPDCLRLVMTTEKSNYRERLEAMLETMALDGLLDSSIARWAMDRNRLHGAKTT